MAKEAAANATEALKRLNSNEEYSMGKNFSAKYAIPEEQKFKKFTHTHALIQRMSTMTPVLAMQEAKRLSNEIKCELMQLQLEKRLNEANDRVEWTKKLPDRHSDFKKAAKKKSDELLLAAKRDLPPEQKETKEQKEKRLLSLYENDALALPESSFTGVLKGFEKKHKIKGSDDYENYAVKINKDRDTRMLNFCTTKQLADNPFALVSISRDMKFEQDMQEIATKIQVPDGGVFDMVNSRLYNEHIKKYNKEPSEKDLKRLDLKASEIATNKIAEMQGAKEAITNDKLTLEERKEAAGRLVEASSFKFRYVT